MKKKQRLKSALLIGTFIGLTACPVGVDRSMLIIHGALPFEPGICVLEGVPGQSTEYIPKGTLEVDLGQTTADYALGIHLSFPFTTEPRLPNINFPNYGNVPTNNNIKFQEAEMLIETETEFTTRLAADQDFDWDTVTQTQEPIAIPVGATSLASTGNYLSEITLPLDNLAAPPIVGDRTPILVHLVIRGTTLDGDKVESSVLQFPIDICNSCLTDITCPSGTVLVPVEQIPCHLGQDFPLFECAIEVAGE